MAAFSVSHPDMGDDGNGTRAGLHDGHLAHAISTDHPLVPSTPISRTFYGGTNGTLFYSGAPGPSALGGGSHTDEGAPGGAHGDAHAPPKFYKLEFASYDGAVDPLNWLNQCEQFFRGQRTLASDRTWLASYHLRGAAQTWYYALEQDEGMPAWEQFRELCQLRFGPPTRGTHLAELARLPFTSMVQDYSDSFNTVLCHERELNAHQKAQLYVGGLPKHIKCDVEMHHPPDLQTTMYYARAYERRTVAFLPALQQLQQRGGRGPRTTAATPAAPAPAQPTATAAPGQPRPLRRLTPAEQVERRCHGLCFNCDEPYVCGHVCKRLFYIETTDYIADDSEDATAEDGPPAAHQEEPATQDATRTSLVVSLHAVAGIRPPNAMLLPVTVKGERFLGLLDTGSTHNFIQGAAMRRLSLSPTGGEHLHVTVANGDRLACEGIARNVPIRIGDEDFAITCVGLNLGVFDFIIGFDFLRTLGPMLWDYEALTLSFWRNGRRVTWQGVSGPTAPMQQQALAVASADPRLPLLDRLLLQHDDLFAEPTGLPSARPYDHRIHLLPGTAPVAVRPYRYPQLQKDELEHQCAAMLAQGIIRPSTSPFSTLVLLV
ncbi:uncharacterized protein [Miscanthus floridulus]|uniref:uncharacterized protein n=1 Tax=Miscanthus floridulus TaxID=154761 RepID=UPI0034581428